MRETGWVEEHVGGTVEVLGIDFCFKRFGEKGLRSNEEVVRRIMKIMLLSG